MNTKMTPDEVLTEVDWLLSYDLHPEHIAKQLGRSVEAITVMARRHGAREIARRFNQVLRAQKFRAAA